MPTKTINFFTSNPSSTDGFSVGTSNGVSFDPTRGSKYLSNNGYINFSLTLSQKQAVNLIVELGALANGPNDHSPIDIHVNTYCILSNYDPQINSFYTQTWAISPNLLNAGINTITIALSAGASSSIFIRSVSVDLYDMPIDKSAWLSGLQDNILISEINLPGTHDSAAIFSAITTPFACQNFYITDQLRGGIRILDVRLKINKNSNGNYHIVTCHGSEDYNQSWLPFNIGEYQSLESLLDECKNFLHQYDRETIIMILKIDYWGIYKMDLANVASAIMTLLSGYPIMTPTNLPTLGDARGKIVLYHRIIEFSLNNILSGVYTDWTDNTPGSYASGHTNYNIYVQDKYENLATIGATIEKQGRVIQTFAMKKNGEVLLNFASAIQRVICGVYVMGYLLNYFGTHPAAQRISKFGWIMFDYPFEEYITNEYGYQHIVSLVIASNFNYKGYELPFVASENM